MCLSLFFTGKSFYQRMRQKFRDRHNWCLSRNFVCIKLVDSPFFIVSHFDLSFAFFTSISGSFKELNSFSNFSLCCLMKSQDFITQTFLESHLRPIILNLKIEKQFWREDSCLPECPGLWLMILSLLPILYPLKELLEKRSSKTPTETDVSIKILIQRSWMSINTWKSPARVSW